VKLLKIHVFQEHLFMWNGLFLIMYVVIRWWLLQVTCIIVKHEQWQEKRTTPKCFRNQAFMMLPNFNICLFVKIDPILFSLIGSVLKVRWGLVSVLTNQLLALPLGYDAAITSCMLAISVHILASPGYWSFILSPDKPRTLVLDSCNQKNFIIKINFVQV
jgi:hypothetical protein